MNREQSNLETYQYEIGAFHVNKYTIRTLRKRLRGHKCSEKDADVIIKNYLNSIFRFAQTYHNKHPEVSLGDFIGAGNLALMNATRGDDFKAFKKKHFGVVLRSYIVKEFNQLILGNYSEPIKVDKNEIVRIAVAEEIYSKCAQQVGREPTSGELIKYLRLRIRDIKGKIIFHTVARSLAESQKGKGPRRIDVLQEIVRRGLESAQSLKQNESAYRPLSSEDWALHAFWKQKNLLFQYLNRKGVLEKLSLDAPIRLSDDPESDTTTHHELVPEHSFDPYAGVHDGVSLRARIASILEHLPSKRVKKEYKDTFLQYYSNRKSVTLDELAEKLKVSRQMVQQEIERIKLEVRRQLLPLQSVERVLDVLKVRGDDRNIYLAYHTSQLSMPTFRQIAKSLGMPTHRVKDTVQRVRSLVDAELEKSPIKRT